MTASIGTAPRPLPGMLAPGFPRVTLHPVGESSLALIGRAGHVFHLNAAATGVARSLLQGEPTALLARRLSERASIGREAARSHVAELQALLRSEQDVQPPSGDVGSLRWSPVVSPPSSGLESRRYRLLDLSFDCTFADHVSRDLAAPAFVHLEAPSDLPAATQFHVEARDGQVRLQRDGLRLDSRIRQATLVNLLRFVFAEAALAGSAAAWALHAAAVARDDRAVLLPGAGGAGKSTLALGLGAAGWTVYGDDTLALTDAFEIRPMPLPLCLKRGSWALARSLLAAAGRGVSGRRSDGLDVRWLAYGNALRMAPAAARAAVGHIVFPVFRRHERTALQPLTTEDALRWLLPGLQALGPGLTPGRLDELIAWVSGRRCFELRFRSLPEAIAAVEALAAG